MVKVGFICEGASDRVILSSESFKLYLLSIGLQLIDDVIDADGCGNLLPHNIEGYIQRLENKGAEKIVIVTDLDDSPCITSVKERIKARPQDVVIVAVKEFETWFLANTTAMRLLLNKPDFEFPNPESEAEPFERINQLLIENTTRGIGKKTAGKQKLAYRFLGLNIQLHEAAQHPNCPSAAYFVNKLQQIANG
jgi:hypothetical protein